MIYVIFVIIGYTRFFELFYVIVIDFSIIIFPFHFTGIFFLINSLYSPDISCESLGMKASQSSVIRDGLGNHSLKGQLRNKLT